MSASERAAALADLPLMPRDDDGPVFAEPWQAQAFAAVVELIESGALSSEEWAETLGAVLNEAEERGEFDAGPRYYEHWLNALERLAMEREFAAPEELATEKREIEANDHHRREHQLGHDH